MKNKNLYFKFQAFGSSKDEFEKYIANGIITWGDPVHRVLEDGDLLISQAKTSTTTPLVTVLVEGGAHRLIALIVIFLFQVVYYINFLLMKQTTSVIHVNQSDVHFITMKIRCIVLWNCIQVSCSMGV